MYAAEDCDVAVFAKLLRYEVAVGYRDRHSQFKARVETALKVLRRDRKAADLTLSEAEKAVERLFPLSDRKGVMDSCRLYAGLHRVQGGLEQLPEAVFIHTLLRHKLQQHEESLHGLRKAFALCDSDDDGCLSQCEFLRFLTHMSPAPDSLTSSQWLHGLDPCNQQVFAFSQCVAFLSSQPGSLLSRFGWR